MMDTKLCSEHKKSLGLCIDCGYIMINKFKSTALKNLKGKRGFISPSGQFHSHENGNVILLSHVEDALK